MYCTACVLSEILKKPADWLCSGGEVDVMAEVSAGNDAVIDDGFVQSTTTASELRNESGLLSIAGSSIFTTPLAQSVKQRWRSFLLHISC